MFNKFKISIMILVPFFVISFTGASAPGETYHTEIDSTEFLRLLVQLKEGQKIDLDSTLIVGDVIAKEIGIDTVRCSVSIRNSRFTGKIDFSNVTFLNEVSFERTIFSKEADFSLAHFKSTSFFDGSEFQEGSSFESTVFDNTASFNSVLFGGKKSKWGPESSPVILGGPSYAGTRGFPGNPMYGYARMGKVIPNIHEGVDFSGAHFKEEVWFNSAKFTCLAWFMRTEFQSANFLNSKFIGDVTFGASKFSGIADFYCASFSENLDLRFCKFQIDKTNLPWQSLEGHLVYHRQTYFNLLNMYRILGDIDTYDEVYYRFRVEKRKNELAFWNPIRFLEWVFLDLMCGYGVKPFRAIYCSIFIIVLFTYFFYKKGAIQCTILEAEDKSTNGDRGRFERLRNALYFSVNTFTRVGYGDWHPTTGCITVKIPFTNKRIAIVRFTTLAMVEGFLGWFLLALFLVTLAKVWIR